MCLHLQPFLAICAMQRSSTIINTDNNIVILKRDLLVHRKGSLHVIEKVRNRDCQPYHQDPKYSVRFRCTLMLLSFLLSCSVLTIRVKITQECQISFYGGMVTLQSVSESIIAFTRIYSVQQFVVHV